MDFILKIVSFFLAFAASTFAAQSQSTEVTESINALGLTRGAATDYFSAKFGMKPDPRQPPRAETINLEKTVDGKKAAAAINTFAKNRVTNLTWTFEGRPYSAKELVTLERKIATELETQGFVLESTAASLGKQSIFGRVQFVFGDDDTISILAVYYWTRTRTKVELQSSLPSREDSKAKDGGGETLPSLLISIQADAVSAKDEEPRAPL